MCCFYLLHFAIFSENLIQQLNNSSLDDVKVKLEPQDVLFGQFQSMRDTMHEDAKVYYQRLRELAGRKQNPRLHLLLFLTRQCLLPFREGSVFILCQVCNLLGQVIMLGTSQTPSQFQEQQGYPHLISMNRANFLLVFQRTLTSLNLSQTHHF